MDLTKNWKAIVGYEERYLVSDTGEVYSLLTNRLLKKHLTNAGYYRVDLYDENGIPTHKTIHRLVATAFIEPIDGWNQVNHKDGVKTNNHIDNLEWSNPQHNMIHALKNGLFKPASGSNHGLGKRTHCLRGHPLSGKNLYVARNGQRQCKICKGFRRNKYKPHYLVKVLGLDR